MIINITLLELKYIILQERLLNLYENNVVSSDDITRISFCTYLTNLIITPIDPFTNKPDKLFIEALRLYKFDEDTNPHKFTETIMKDLIRCYLKDKYCDFYILQKNKDNPSVYFLSKNNLDIQIRMEGSNILEYFQ